MGRVWTGREQEWILDHGIQINEGGMLVITKSKWRKLQYTGRSLRNPAVRTLCIPSDFGLCLLFENQHFCIVDG